MCVFVWACMRVAKDVGPAHKMKLNLCTVTKLRRCICSAAANVAGCRSVLHKTFKSSQDAAKHAHWDRLGQAGRAGQGQGRNSKFEWQRLAAAKPKTGCALWQQTRLPCCGKLAESSRNATVWQSAPQSVYACFDFALLSAAI